MEELAPAKINLAIHVRERMPDGYHRIETIFAFAEDGDRLRVSASDELSLVSEGPFASSLGTENLVMTAAQALRERAGVREGARLLLDKRLPIASGIGGGSADAAAALRLLSRWWGLETPELLEEIAAGLGADVPACLAGRMARGEGRGDQLVSQDGEGLSGTPSLLVNPGVQLSTAAVFAAWDGIDQGPLPIASPLAAALEGRNDLEASARLLVPEIGRLLAMLERAPGVLLSRMSGSGATCFALFDTEEHRDAASSEIAACKPNWWQLKTRLA